MDELKEKLASGLWLLAVILTAAMLYHYFTGDFDRKGGEQQGVVKTDDCRTRVVIKRDDPITLHRKFTCNGPVCQAVDLNGNGSCQTVYTYLKDDTGAGLGTGARDAMLPKRSDYPAVMTQEQINAAVDAYISVYHENAPEEMRKRGFLISQPKKKYGSEMPDGKEQETPQQIFDRLRKADPERPN